MAFTLRVPAVHHPELFKKQQASEEEKARDLWHNMSHKHGVCSREAISARKAYEQLRGRPIGVLA